MTLLQGIEHWEPVWLLLILSAELVVSSFTLYWVFKEFKYDEHKDIEKKQKRTRTTRKTTKGADGSVTEENTEEIITPLEDKKEN